MFDFCRTDVGTTNDSKSAWSFSDRNSSEPPSGHGRLRLWVIEIGRRKKHLKNTHIKNWRDPQHKDLRALVLYVWGGLLSFIFQEKNTHKKIYLGWVSVPTCLFPRISRAWPTPGNADSFTIFLFTIFVPLTPPLPKQRSYGLPLKLLFKGPHTELHTLSRNCEQTLQNLRTNRIMNKRAFLICFWHFPGLRCRKKGSFESAQSDSMRLTGLPSTNGNSSMESVVPAMLGTLFA